LEAAQLAEEGESVRNITMFGNFTVLKSKHVYDIEVQALPAGLNVEPWAASMRSGRAAIHPDKIIFRNNLFNGIAEIGHSLEYCFEKFYKSVSALRAIRVVLDIILAYELIQIAHVMINNYLRAKSFNKFFIRLCGIHVSVPILPGFEAKNPI
jgi:hypothetical protein